MTEQTTPPLEEIRPSNRRGWETRQPNPEQEFAQKKHELFESGDEEVGAIKAFVMASFDEKENLHGLKGKLLRKAEKALVAGNYALAESASSGVITELHVENPDKRVLYVQTEKTAKPKLKERIEKQIAQAKEAIVEHSMNSYLSARVQAQETQKAALQAIDDNGEREKVSKAVNDMRIAETHVQKHSRHLADKFKTDQNRLELPLEEVDFERLRQEEENRFDKRHSEEDTVPKEVLLTLLNENIAPQLQGAALEGFRGTDDDERSLTADQKREYAQNYYTVQRELEVARQLTKKAIESRKANAIGQYSDEYLTYRHASTWLVADIKVNALKARLSWLQKRNPKSELALAQKEKGQEKTAWGEFESVHKGKDFRNTIPDKIVNVSINKVVDTVNWFKGVKMGRLEDTAEDRRKEFNTTTVLNKVQDTVTWFKDLRAGLVHKKEEVSLVLKKVKLQAQNLLLVSSIQAKKEIINRLHKVHLFVGFSKESIWAKGAQRMAGFVGEVFKKANEDASVEVLKDDNPDILPNQHTDYRNLYGKQLISSFITLAREKAAGRSVKEILVDEKKNLDNLWQDVGELSEARSLKEQGKRYWQELSEGYKNNPSLRKLTDLALDRAGIVVGVESGIDRGNESEWKAWQKVGRARLQVQEARRDHFSKNRQSVARTENRGLTRAIDRHKNALLGGTDRDGNPLPGFKDVIATREQLLETVAIPEKKLSKAQKKLLKEFDRLDVSIANASDLIDKAKDRLPVFTSGKLVSFVESAPERELAKLESMLLRKLQIVRELTGKELVANTVTRPVRSDRPDRPRDPEIPEVLDTLKNTKLNDDEFYAWKAAEKYFGSQMRGQTLAKDAFKNILYDYTGTGGEYPSCYETMEDLDDRLEIMTPPEYLQSDEISSLRQYREYYIVDKEYRKLLSDAKKMLTGPDTDAWDGDRAKVLATQIREKLIQKRTTVSGLYTVGMQVEKWLEVDSGDFDSEEWRAVSDVVRLQFELYNHYASTNEISPDYLIAFDQKIQIAQEIYLARIAKINPDADVSELLAKAVKDHETLRTIAIELQQDPKHFDGERVRNAMNAVANNVEVAYTIWLEGQGVQLPEAQLDDLNEQAAEVVETDPIKKLENEIAKLNDERGTYAALGDVWNIVESKGEEIRIKTEELEKLKRERAEKETPPVSEVENAPNQTKKVNSGLTTEQLRNLPKEEAKPVKDRLKKVVIDGVVENRRNQGYDFGSPDKKSIHDIVGTQISGLVPEQGDVLRKGDATRVVFVPVSGLRDQTGLKRFEPDIAVCFSLWGQKTDSTQTRDGSFRGVVIMNRLDAAQFQVALEKDPTLIFQLAETVNGGPIRRFDQNPADLVPGKAITILANNKYGGSQTEAIKTEEFPTGYKPNQLEQADKSLSRAEVRQQMTNAFDNLNKFL